MTTAIFGWDYPPGVSTATIDRHFAADEWMTVYDDEGEAYRMVWEEDLTYDATNWCAFCERPLTAGWVCNLGASGLFILCDDCAQANSKRRD